MRLIDNFADVVEAAVNGGIDFDAAIGVFFDFDGVIADYLDADDPGRKKTNRLRLYKEV